MLIADSHEFIELYRGDKDIRAGIEFLKLDEGIRYVSFAPDMASPIDRDRFNAKYVREIGLPELPIGYDLQLLSSKAIRFKKKETGGIVSYMPGYRNALFKAAPDIIFENPYSWLTPRSYQTYSYSKKAGVPVIYYDPGDDIPISNKHRLMAIWEKPVVHHVSAIITYNEAGRNRFINKYGYPKEKIYVIPKPIDVSACQYHGDVSQLRRRFGVRENTIVVGYVGRLAKYKSSSILLEVAKMAASDDRFSDFLFVFIGGALASTESENDYKLSNTHVTGMVPHDDVAKYIAACDIIAYPENNPDFGGFSTAIAETMAAGKAIIFGTKNPGFYVPLRNDDTAKVIPPCNPSAVANALLELANNRDMILKLGNAVRQYASEQMDYPIVVKRYYEIMKQILNNTARE
ncbi:glycosyltransferase family 4 protein [Adlercreutzia sp. ZJ141]|uniref:glycosyltransferase family 4 protein n=1 Tax=Adlercreutzia sp. ZJ141 TaxID=2709406 RepID=UPI0013EDE688|nr:glycosyltransferase family 4 protein [Adlercreutzia sp. ZJ141]